MNKHNLTIQIISELSEQECRDAFAGVLGLVALDTDLIVYFLQMCDDLRSITLEGCRNEKEVKAGLDFMEKLRSAYLTRLAERN